MKIPFFSLHRQWNDLKNNIRPAIDEVLENQVYIGGDIVTQFESACARYLQVPYAISCNSGTDALWLAQKALDLKPNSLVLTTPFSFMASSSEIVAHGAIPIFIDIEEGSYNISTTKLTSWLEQNAIMKNDKAFHKKSGFPIVGIIPVDLFGQCANYAELWDIAKTWNLWIIEDAAQSMGAKFKDHAAGSLGTISCISFYPTKNLGAYGDGGMMTTHDEDLARYLFRLKNHGRASHYAYEHLGLNSRLDALQAAILHEKLKVLDALNARRRAIAQLYREHLADVPFIQLPKTLYGTHVFHQFSIRVCDAQGVCYRDDLMQHLEQHDIGTRIFYPQGLHTYSFLQSDKQFITPCPVTDTTIQSILSLPMWPELTDEEVIYICDTIKQMPLPLQKNQEQTRAVAYAT